MCIRCSLPGHWVQRCKAQHTNCEACGKLGHSAKACHTRDWNSTPTAAQAHSLKAYINKGKSEPRIAQAQAVTAFMAKVSAGTSPIDKFLIAADRTGRAIEYGLTYNINTESIEEECSEEERNFVMLGQL